MSRAFTGSAAALLLFAGLLACGSIVPAAAAAREPEPSPLNHDPEAEIHFWYGDAQTFGSPGLAQPWVNILGHVEGHEQAASLRYSINDGPLQPLTTGPDNRRLAASGDFNIELAAKTLREGNNTILVQTSPREKGQKIDLDFRSRSWPLPYAIDWAKVRRVQDGLQVVDGMWLLTGTGIRTAPARIGYDRSLALGDRSWTGYEILLPITLHAVDSSAYDSPTSVAPGFGLIMHWNGHTNTPVNCGALHCGWLPAGAALWYNFPRDGQGGLNITTGPLPDLSVAFPYTLVLETTYLLRARTEPRPLRTLYFLKIWRQGTPEPAEWSLRRVADRKDPGHGGVLLVAHHVDLTIGRVEVRPVAPPGSAAPADRPALNGMLREYLGLAPLGLTLAAGLLFLMPIRGQGTKGRRKAALMVGGAISAAILCFVLEPCLPFLLRWFPLNAGTAALLYLGFDVFSRLCLALAWIIILLDQRSRRKGEATG